MNYTHLSLGRDAISSQIYNLYKEFLANEPL